MFRRVHARVSAVVGVLALTAATVIAGGADSTVETSDDVNAAARRLVEAILDPRLTKARPPFTSDVEHARTIDPVLTDNVSVWIHEALPAPPMTVMGGRVFTYQDVPYDPIEAPVLKIRPIDDGQSIAFVVRVVIELAGALSPEATLTVSIPAPPVFGPTVANVTTWVGARQVKPSIDSSAVAGEISIRVPLVAPGTEPRDQTVQPVTVIVEGKLLLDPYRTLQPGRFRNVADVPYPPAVERLSRLEVGRDGGNQEELQKIREIAAALLPGAATDYDRVVAVNSWVASSLRYRRSPSTRSPLEALEDRSGDCDEHTALMVAMLRAMGIASRRASGLLYNLDTLSAHSWAEVALPNREGDLHWFIADPTLAGATQTEDERFSFVQLKNRILLYPMRPETVLTGTGGRRTTDVLLNWRKDDVRAFADGIQADLFVDQVIAGVDQALSDQVQTLIADNRLLHRESSTVAGSPYLIVDRPVAQETQTRIRLLLENEERLVLELDAPVAEALGSEADLEAVGRLGRVFSELENLFFGGVSAHRNIELVYSRDRHTDRLHTVSLRCGRYLVETHLDRILKTLSRNDFLTEEEIATLSRVAEVSGGKNLYIFQELARQYAE